ncbi:hypothetical protein NBRGN_110_03900 [Nocardia brasiliensis NBRC 14402]|nr:hypothetical protein NBRGN_110_03900 [Nocardia brasiliensis NBRC 14402]
MIEPRETPSSPDKTGHVNSSTCGTGEFAGREPITSISNSWVGIHHQMGSRPTSFACPANPQSIVGAAQFRDFCDAVRYQPVTVGAAPPLHQGLPPVSHSGTFLGHPSRAKITNV